MSDTIVAQATPPGRGGVGIVRVSGPEVLSLAQAILGKTLPVRVATLSNFYHKDGTMIDQGIALYFTAPHSFTGEEVLELHGHGSQMVMDLLLQRVLGLGARLAKPGEFTERAFLNGKLDLAQVEAVADLINASTHQAAQNAARSLQGEFSREITSLVALLTKLRAQVEAAIDFSEEDVVPQQGRQTGPASFGIVNNIYDLQRKLQQLKSSAQQGVILREGVTVVIAGDPNAGKSSLLNCLSGQDAAIVTDIPGTTRDIMRVWIQLDGLSVNLLDTAGLREDPDLIEKEGIRRAKEEIQKADQVFLMVDAAANNTRSPKELAAAILNGSQQLTILYNKIDLTGEKPKIVKVDGIDCIYLSVKEKKGLELLKEHLKDSAGFGAIENGFSARRRHLDALERAEMSLQNIGEELLNSSNLELIAEELKQAQSALGEITGEVTPEDLLDKIFAEFCVGK